MFRDLRAVFSPTSRTDGFLFSRCIADKHGRRCQYNQGADTRSIARAAVVRDGGCGGGKQVAHGRLLRARWCSRAQDGKGSLLHPGRQHAQR